jgi:hypothetical protein
MSTWKAIAFRHTETGAIAYGGDLMLVEKFDNWVPMDLNTLDDLKTFIAHIEHRTAKRIREETR